MIKGITTEEFYPIAQANDTHNMERGKVYAVADPINFNMKLVVRVRRDDGFNGIENAFILPPYTNRLTSKKTAQITTQIPPDCIEEVLNMHLPERERKKR